MSIPASPEELRSHRNEEDSSCDVAGSRRYRRRSNRPRSGATAAAETITASSGCAAEPVTASSGRAAEPITTRSGAAAEERNQRPRRIQRLHRRARAAGCRGQDQRLRSLSHAVPQHRDEGRSVGTTDGRLPGDQQCPKNDRDRTKSSASEPEQPESAGAAGSGQANHGENAAGSGGCGPVRGEGSASTADLAEARGHAGRRLSEVQDANERDFQRRGGYERLSEQGLRQSGTVPAS